jgi:hypothetical protein
VGVGALRPPPPLAHALAAPQHPRGFTPLRVAPPHERIVVKNWGDYQAFPEVRARANPGTRSPERVPRARALDGHGLRNLICVKFRTLRLFEIGDVPTDLAGLIFYIAMAVAVISTTAAVWVLLR